MKAEIKLVDVIKCPYCDMEYLPCEIFYPDEFLGQETNIERDNSGKIVYYEGVSATTKETYVCDNCNKQFSIKVNRQFITSKDEQNNLNHNYYTIKPAKLFLDEGE